MEELKLYMVLLGSKPLNRTVEQHDYFFGIARSLQELIPQMIAFWPEAGSSLHIDGWREVTNVEDHSVKITLRNDIQEVGNGKRLFFVNLGGYKSGKLEEQHYTLLTVQNDRKGAIKTSTMTDFFKASSIASVKSASAHIDEKYGIDVDDIYRIEDVLSEEVRAKYHIELSLSDEAHQDQIHLGYHKLDKI